MKIIIPVAGLGSRFKPITDNIQKCLLPVGGKPILGHIIDRLASIDVSELVLIVGSFGNQVRDYVESLKLNYKITFIEQKKRFGLGHAILHGLDDIESSVLILLGDTIIEMDYNIFVDESSNMVAVDKVDDPTRYGIIELDNDKISGFIEKPEIPPTDLALVGVYKINFQSELKKAIEKLIDDDIKTNKEYQLTDALSLMVNDGADFMFQQVEKNLDCGIPESIININKYLLSDRSSSYISPHTIIDNSKISNCTIMENCKISNSKLNNVIVLNNSIIKDKIISDAIIGYDKIFYKQT